jgi:hypothetical protein
MRDFGKQGLIRLFAMIALVVAPVATSVLVQTVPPAYPERTASSAPGVWSGSTARSPMQKTSTR